MPKFKAGEKVWIKPLGEIENKEKITRFVVSMEAYCGNEARISYISGIRECYVLEENPYIWEEDWLESEEEHKAREAANNTIVTATGAMFLCECGEDFTEFVKKVHDVFKKKKEEKIRMNTPKSVIFNNPATIVFWKDGSKTVAKAHNEAFDPEKGLAICYAKKALGDGYEASKKFDRIVKKYLPKAKATDDDEPKVNPAVELVEQLNDLERRGVVLSRAKKYKFDDGQVVQFSKKIDCWVISLDK